MRVQYFQMVEVIKTPLLHYFKLSGPRGTFKHVYKQTNAIK
jgi:hypothetical protein